MRDGARDAKLLFRFALFLASVGFFAYAAMHAPKVEAGTPRWVIYQGVCSATGSCSLSGITNYGWHFDEGGFAYFGARDFNHPNDSPPGTPLRAYLRAKVTGALWAEISYLLWPGPDQCRTFARPQAYDPYYGVWYQLTPGVDLHYLHVNNPVTGVTGTMYSIGSTIKAQVGTIAKNGTSCAQGGPAHLHQSGDMQYNYVVGAGYNGDTCWANGGLYDDICLAGGPWWRDHVACDPDDWDDVWVPITGSFAEYVCEEWSEQNFGNSAVVFTIVL